MINIDILKPQCRLDDLWVRVITKNDVDLPLPQSILELYVTALITGNIDNLPYPQSRVEMLLYCILTDTEYTFNAQSRVEMFLKAIITLDIEGLPTPMSRLEWYLDYIVRNGCLEKYEYYPFSIWNYLNVKNTPKARMKFKGMKGNTLVNLENNKSRMGKWLMDESDNAYITKPITGYCGFSIPITFSKDKKYTIIYTVISNTTNKTSLPIIAITKNIQSEIIGSLSVGTHAVSITPKETCISPSQWDDHFRFVIHSTNTEVSGNISISNKITILEGDYTQNPPNGYIEGMKSFGESENKIEVLSDNNLQGELNQSSKATLMYRNSSNELVPVPALRGKWEGDRFLWGDEILLHEDGKLYYHKRYEFVLITGLESKGWSINGVSKFLEFVLPHGASADFNLICDKLQRVVLGATTPNDSIGVCPTKHNAIRIKPFEKNDMTLEEGLNWVKSNNLSLVYQLDKEEVYPCELSEQLYSYDGETNIFIGGDVVGETTIEIGTKLGPIVAGLKQETKIVTDGLKGVLAGNMQELAYQLYPDDFNKDNTVEIKPIESA